MSVDDGGVGVMALGPHDREGKGREVMDGDGVAMATPSPPGPT